MNDTAHPAPVAAWPVTWIDRRPVPLDFGGPQDVPYEPLPDSASAILGLQAVERAAARDPAKTALFDGQVRLTYAELLDRTYGLAHRLSEQLPYGSPVVSLMFGSAAAPVIMLACAAAGLTLIPIDAAHPAERIAAIFQDSGAAALILAAGDDVDHGWVQASVPRIVVDVSQVSGAARYQSRVVAANAPMMVVFSSGSTGRPKGVVYGNDDGVRAMRGFVDSFHINRADVIIGVASMSTGGMRDAFAALTTGATLRIVDLKRVGITEVLRVMAVEGVTLLSFVPTVLRSLMQLPGIEAAFQHLRVLDLHGELTLASDIRLFRSRLPPQCLISITLGTTEAGTLFSWFVDESRFEGNAVPVGYLFPGKAIAILRDDGSPADAGEVGELYVRGHLALGSWEAGRVTDSRFFRDPADPATRIYQTGDLIRLRADGLAEFVGRKNRQIKIRGLWADLGEIESALRSAPAVRDAVVIVQSQEHDADTLVAFVVARTDAPREFVAMLRKAVIAATAEHMAPSQIIILETIPRLPNYKPDLRKLDLLCREDTGRT